MTKTSPPHKLPPPPKKNIVVKQRITSIFSSRSVKSPTILFGLECENGVFIAWLEKPGPIKEAAFMRPFVTAFDATINDQSTLDLYPDRSMQGSMLELWKIDYIMNRRETTREQSNSILFSKGYPFKCFVWMRPDEGPDASMSLDTWLHNLNEQMMHFVRFTTKNDSLYGSFKWGLNIRVVIDTAKHFLAQELLDGDVLRIIQDSYHGVSLEDLLHNESIRLAYFGPNRNTESLLELL